MINLFHTAVYCTHTFATLGRSYLVEVVAADNPGGPAARCETTVEPINPPALRNLKCSRLRGGEKRVRLNWGGNGNYVAYEIERNGIVIGRTDETAWIDELPPLGTELRYSVAGLTSRGQRGPASFCTQEFEQPPQVGLSGQVVFDDSESTPLGRGAVLVFLPGEDEAIARAAVDEEGRFRISTEELGEDARPPFDLEYRAPFLDHIRLGLLDTFEARGNQQGPRPQRHRSRRCRGGRCPGHQPTRPPRSPAPPVPASAVSYHCSHIKIYLLGEQWFKPSRISL